jgi:ribosome-associated toxin RatA of RatAB toxin-antitoxin module
LLALQRGDTTCHVTRNKRTLAYGANGLFEVVAGVRDYPLFVFWCRGAHIHREDNTEIIADLVIGFGPFQEGSQARSRWTDRAGISAPSKGRSST